MYFFTNPFSIHLIFHFLTIKSFFIYKKNSSLNSSSNNFSFFNNNFFFIYKKNSSLISSSNKK